MAFGHFFKRKELKFNGFFLAILVVLAVFIGIQLFSVPPQRKKPAAAVEKFWNLFF